MKEIKFIIIILVVQLSNQLFGQADYNLNIQINNEYSKDTIITPFNGEVVTALSVSGNVEFNSDYGFVRLIVSDAEGNEYLIYESYPMISEGNQFDFDYECEESCFFESYQPVAIELQIQDASIQIDELNCSNTNYTNVDNLRKQAKYSRNLSKLDAVQDYIRDHNLIWVAEETDLSRLSYKNKAELWGRDYRSFGFEFYSAGYYSMHGPTESDHTLNHGYVGNFDWRNRHGANQTGSPYYDGDENGTGWMTPVVCQGLGCWLNGEFICNTPEEECAAMGGDYRTAGTCWIFGPTAYIEGLTNLYYNEHIDVDLSEQFIACQEGTVDPYVTRYSFDHYKNTGVPDEDCLTYSASLENCGDLCNNPSERIQISDYKLWAPNDHRDTRSLVMEYGPVLARVMHGPWGPQSHAMSLVGWGVIDEDELDIMGVTNPTTSDWYGHTYWIYKESSGPGVHHNGFRYMIHWEGQEPYIISATLPLYSLNRTNADINCYDKDGDGYYFWGIGPKPAHCPPCPDEPDGDDSNPGLGPLTDNGTCKIINTYNASFEEDWDNWIQIDSDDQDWWRHKGPTPTHEQHHGITGPAVAQDGDFYIYTEASCNGCYSLKKFTIESPIIDLLDYCKISIDFHYHLHSYLWGNPDNAKLELQISYDEGDTWEPDYWSVLNDQGSEWHHVNINLPINVTKVRFVGRTTYNEFSDIALDNITIGPVHANDTPITISNSNTIWDKDKEVYSNIIIKDGATLTIKNSTILMHDETSIIIQQGGKLVINNSAIKALCEQNKWQGIQVWGDKNQSQKTLADGSCAQGKLILKNGATIENAIVAVDLWKPEDWSTTGGMVYATDAVFRNNAKAVHALHYRNFNPQHPQIEWKYFSNFKNCTFEITEDYTGEETFHKHVDLSHVKGINFQACDFSVAKNAENVSTYSSAIMAYNAKFAVNAICNSAQEPCPEGSYDRSSFTGFYTAIKAFNDSRMPVTFSVNKADFINNAYGVKTQGMHNASVLSSHFEIGELWGCGAGIYADCQSGFAFEENDFSKYAGAPDANYFGILINNSEAVNEVYKNSFNGLTYANFADGKNWTESPYKGLAYYCNNNSNNYADFFMNNQSMIQSKQGGNNYAVGNTFSQNGATWHFYNGGTALIDYYYNQNASDEIPDDDKIYNINKIGINNTNTCPSHYDNDISTRQLVLTPQQKTIAEETYINNLTDYNAVKTLYDSYVDGGNTQAEKMAIQTAQPSDMWALRAQLLGDSPHLSLEVLKEAADKTEVFTEAALFDILAANPDELKKDTLIRYLENKETPLPAYMIDLLKQVATGTTYKTALQQQMANYQHAYTRAAHDIIRSNLNDTVSNYVELRNWLDNLGGIVADRQIIASYISEHNFTDALALANMLPQLYNLKGKDLTEHNYYMDMLTLYQILAQEGRNTYQLNSTEKANLTSIANHSQGVAGAQARGILEAVYNIGYPECPEVNETNGSYAPHSAISPDVLNQVYDVNISVKPNPAKEWAAFEYTLPSQNTTAIISITDAGGSEVAILNISGAQGQKLWDTRHVKSGIYIYTLKAAGFTQSGKIVITK